jgi:predicted tellurium resistance membrane protein TerC
MARTSPHAARLPRAIIWILIMNIVFSFDTVLSAVALTKELHRHDRRHRGLWRADGVMADHVANFLKKNRMYEVLGLFVLLLVGYMLIVRRWSSRPSHLLRLCHRTDGEIDFLLRSGTLVIVEIIQSRYQKRILEEQDRDKQETDDFRSIRPKI